MNEQQRIFVTVMTCLSIWLGWQYFQGDLTPPTEVAGLSQHTDAAPNQSPSVAPSPMPSNAPASPLSLFPKPAHAVERDFRTPLMAGAMRNGDAGLVRLDLLQFNERADGAQGDAGLTEAVSMVTPPNKQAMGLDAVQAAIVWELGGAMPPPLDYTGSQGLILAGTAPNGLQIQIEAVPRNDAYALDYVLRITNGTDQPLPAGAAVDLALTPWVKESSSYFAPPSDPLHGLCDVRGSLDRRNLKDLASKGPYTSSGPATWAALDRQYFVTAVVPSEGSHGTCTMRAQGDTLSMRYSFTGRTLTPHESWEQRFSLYAGPKRDSELAQVSHALKSTIDYTFLKVPLGFLARPMVALLGIFHGLTSSWGVSIMLLTLSIKLLLFPVSYKSVLSMRRVQELKPELDKIKVKYEHDKERQQMETLKLYRDRGVNPVGGCLPMLLQMPVWLTLYRTLWSAVDLYQQPFLWLPDLTAPEPLPVLAILVGLVTVGQQRLTPMAVDNQQARVMMYVMPILFTGFMVALPSGLVLYIMTNSILTIFQQLAINRRQAVSPQKVSGR